MKPLKYIRKTFVVSDNKPTAVLCLASIIKYHKGDVNLEYLISLSQTIDGITKLSNLVQAAESVGLKTIGEKSTLERLKKINIPAILHVKNDDGDNDFMVCYGFSNHYFLTGIPSWGLMQFREDEMEVFWESQIMLYLEPESSFVVKQSIPEKIQKCLIPGFIQSIYK